MKSKKKRELRLQAEQAIADGADPLEVLAKYRDRIDAKPVRSGPAPGVPRKKYPERLVNARGAWIEKPRLRRRKKGKRK